LKNIRQAEFSQEFGAKYLISANALKILCTCIFVCQNAAIELVSSYRVFMLLCIPT